MPKGKPATLEEMPIADLRDAMANYDKVSLKITRRNEKGQIATVYSDVLMTLEELLGIDGWLRTNAGGGRFRVECRNPQDKSKYIVQPFHVGVEGLPRPPRFLGNPAHMDPTRQIATNPAYPQAGMEQQPMSQNPYHPQVPSGPYYGQQQPQGPYGPPPPAWLNGVHPSQRGGYIGPRYRVGSGDNPAPGATVASDTLAMRQLEKAELEAKTQIAKLEAQNAALMERLDRMAHEAKSERERAREERHSMELKALEARMESLSKPKEATGPSDLIAALAPFAPVFATMITARESSSSKSLEVQQAGLQSLMQATLSQANKPDTTMDLVKSLLPVVLPMAQNMMDAKSPKAQAELFNSMVENNLNSVAMMAQLIEAFASSGGDEPWWLPMVRETMGGVVGMTEAYMQGKGLPGQQPAVPRPLAIPQAAPALPDGVPQQAGMAAYSTIDMEAPPSEEVPEHAAVAGVVADAPAVESEEYEDEEQPSAAEMERRLKEDASAVERLMLTQLPEDFQTPEWRIIALSLHQTEEIEEVANMVSGHVAHLINFGMLPHALFDFEEAPQRALARCFGPLPVAQERPAFVRAVTDAVITALVEDGFLKPDVVNVVVPTETAEVVAAVSA